MHSTYLPVWLWVLGSHQERCTQDWCPRSVVFAKVVRNQMVPSRAEWRGETDNRATPPVSCCPSTASFSVRPYCKNARRDRCQEYHYCFPFRGLEETTRMSSNYVDEDYPARPEIKQSLTGWGDNCVSESSTLESDVCVWRYAPLVVHAAQEEEEEEPHYLATVRPRPFFGERWVWRDNKGLSLCKEDGFVSQVRRWK